MSQSICTFHDVLDWMESGQVFSLSVVAYDKQRKRGGQLLEYPEAVLLHENDDVELRTEAGRPLTTMEAARAKLENLQRNPRHGKWFTRNIRILQQGHPTGIIKKVHIPLIIKFNDLPVTP